MPSAEDLVFAVIDDVNAMLPPEQRLLASGDQLLLGGAGPIDSLGLVTLITAVEDRVLAEVGVAVSLMDAAALEHEPSPYQSLGAMVAYLGGLLPVGLADSTTG
jgi:D-alanine--poly(phosphoribitol) ligase subunit 2